MSDTTPELTLKPPSKVEDLFAATAGNQFANINRPTAGAREEKILPTGEAPFQFYSLATPNGQKPHFAGRTRIESVLYFIFPNQHTQLNNKSISCHTRM